MFDTYEVGKRMKDLREEIGMTQEKLSETLHISRNYLARIESGSRNPSIVIYVEAAEFFGVTLDYLLLGKKQDNAVLRKDLRAVISSLKFIESQM